MGKCGEQQFIFARRVMTYNYEEIDKPSHFRVRHGVYRAELIFNSKLLRDMLSVQIADWCSESLRIDRWVIYCECRPMDLTGSTRTSYHVIICEFSEQADAALFKMTWKTGS